jgi:molybdenum cofactor cytidylyltransferase
MGQAKQLLPLGGSTILAQTIANVLSSQVEETILVLGSSAPDIQRQLPQALLEQVKIVINRAFEQGMASSLQQGLSAVDQRSHAALIILGDQPFVRPGTLEEIMDHSRRSGRKIAIPVYQGQRGNPVLLDRSLFAEAMALKGDVGCRAIFARHLEEIVNVEVEDRGVLMDIDDPDDYQRLNTMA